MTRRTKVAEERKRTRVPQVQETGVTQISFPFLLLSFNVLFLYFETISWSEKGVCKGQISMLYDPLGSLPYSVVCVFGITLSDANIIPFTMFT